MAFDGFPECPPLAGTEDRTPSGARKVGGGFYPKPAPETSGKMQVCGSEAVRLKTAAALC